MTAAPPVDCDVCAVLVRWAFRGGMIAGTLLGAVAVCLLRLL